MVDAPLERHNTTFPDRRNDFARYARVHLLDTLALYEFDNPIRAEVRWPDESVAVEGAIRGYSGKCAILGA
jgi:hypothetical protein